MPKNNRSTENKNEAHQLNFWLGKNGNSYIERNKFEEWMLKPGAEAFERILGSINFQSVLEVGSNIGRNLIYLTHLYGDTLELYAVEPNKTAFDGLTSEPRLKTLRRAWNCKASNLPIADASIDLVFTSGVLIHITPDELQRATDEIVRVSKKYVLCIEYFSHKPESVAYRGKTDLLFKRDFGTFYLDTYPELNCCGYGFLWQREFLVFDNLTWWLFKK
ncbi:MAG: methyltransferase domain-containing protein [Desulfobacterales bacterium]|jgi:pseudaminic acid biosynthesis-associated methylase